MSLRIAADAASHAGAVRPRNEDSLAQRPELGLWAVADGAGGHGAGDVASQAVAAALAGLPALRQALHAVNADLHRQGQAAHRTLASTVVAALVQEEACHLLWAGDSRAYLLRDGRLQRLTCDHSPVQELLDTGAINEAQAEGHPQASVILRALGAEAALLLDEASYPLRPGDALLLCSDGLYWALEETALAALLAEGTDASAVLAAALARDPRDNVTAIVLHLAA